MLANTLTNDKALSVNATSEYEGQLPKRRGVSAAVVLSELPRKDDDTSISLKFMRMNATHQV